MWTWDWLLGAAKTPRGYHVWLRTALDGWTGKSALTWLRLWLAAQDRGVVGRDGGIDIRAGDRSYLVWPGGSGEPGRRWMSTAEWSARVAAASAGWQWDVEWTAVEQWGPPWLAGAAVGPAVAVPAQDREQMVRGVQAAEYAGRGDKASGAGDEDRLEVVRNMGPEWAAERLTLALATLAEMAPGTGRNNRLNQIAYYQGATAVWVGAGSFDQVADELVAGGERAGTHGVRATVRSGLGAGLGRLGA